MKKKKNSLLQCSLAVCPWVSLLTFLSLISNLESFEALQDVVTLSAI